MLTSCFSTSNSDQLCFFCPEHSTENPLHSSYPLSALRVLRYVIFSSLAQKKYKFLPQRACFRCWQLQINASQGFKTRLTKAICCQTGWQYGHGAKFSLRPTLQAYLSTTWHGIWAKEPIKEAKSLHQFKTDVFWPRVQLHVGTDPWLLRQTKISTLLLSVKSQRIPSARLRRLQSPGGFRRRGSQTDWNSVLQEVWMALSKGLLIQKRPVH